MFKGQFKEMTPSFSFKNCMGNKVVSLVKKYAEKKVFLKKNIDLV